VVLTPTTPATEFAALDLVGTVTSVTIASPPVVNFKLATPQGVPVIGFGSSGKCYPRNNTTTPYAANCYPNLAFSLAKLVPGSGGTPSKWVNYIVTTVPTVAAGGTVGAVGLSTPSTDNTGTLVDNGDGTYKYTFYRDVPGIKAQVDGITPPAGSNKADLGDLTYDASLTHRLTIQIAGAAPGTGSNNPSGLSTGFPASVNMQNPVNVIYDFVPATGQAPAASANRKMVDNANCESCHSTLGGLPGGDGGSLDFHGGSRNNIEYCVICHTDQRVYGRSEATYDAATRAFSGSTYKVNGRAVGNAPNFLHKIHVAGVMTKTGYDYGGVKFDLGGYSQDIRNCEKCHDPANAATPQAALWKTSPNRLACGSCHDGIDFATGLGLTLADKAAGLSSSTGFFGKAHPDNATDATCQNAGCHGVGSGGDPDLVHFPVTPPNKNNSLQVPLSTEVAGSTGNSNTNAGWIASNASRLPAGAIKVEYEIDTVSLNASRNPVMKFRLKQNGVVTPLQDFATATPNAVTGQKEIWANYMGGPSVYFVFAVPQDGITAPADFNGTASVYLRSLWNGTSSGNSLSTLTGPDTAGWYTATITGTTIPTNAVMLTGGLGYSYNARSSLPLTQTNLADYPATASTLTTGLTAGMPNAWGGLIVIAKNTQKVATGFTGRRAIVEDARCNKCHQELGTFTEDAFHAGQRNDGTTCSWCHTPNRNSSGWTADTPNMAHAIHGAGKRTQVYTWHSAVTAGDSFGHIVYPGVLARCEQCHLPGTYDFSASGSAAAAGLTDGVDKRQFRYISGTIGLTDISKSPYVTAGAVLGLPFSVNAGNNATTGASGQPANSVRIAADTNLVMSPTVSACVGCHDSPLAISHFEVNGGRFYDPRLEQFATGSDTRATTATTEQCMICHSTGRTADIKAVHAK
jgi:OmcA/MtrC family decaheme c-type cytochrome